MQQLARIEADLRKRITKLEGFIDGLRDAMTSRLVDADRANPRADWQGAAGSGADVVPYFRVFNPETQSRRFDSVGRYLRTWQPELARLPNDLLHAPWEVPAGFRAAPLSSRARMTDTPYRWCRIAFGLEAAALPDDAPPPEGYDA